MLRLYGIKIAVVLASLYNFNMIGEKNVRFICLTCSLQLKRILTENKFSPLIVMTLRSHKYFAILPWSLMLYNMCEGSGV